MLVLVGCVVLVAAWQLLAARAARPWEEFSVRPDAFRNLAPSHGEWIYETVPVTDDPLEPNIVCYKALPPRRPGQAEAWQPPVLVRVAHGYNMVDCMRIKHYEVRPVAQATNLGESEPLPRQAWHLVSETGDESIWLTTMVRAADMVPLTMDVRAMAFPRVGTPDDPGYAPSGFRLASLRRPWHNLKRVVRSRWNSSRCDLLTFLRLRQPAYMSDELLTVVTTSPVPQGLPERHDARVAEALQHGLEVHAAMLADLAGLAND